MVAAFSTLAAAGDPSPSDRAEAGKFGDFQEDPGPRARCAHRPRAGSCGPGQGQGSVPTAGGSVTQRASNRLANALVLGERSRRLGLRAVESKGNLSTQLLNLPGDGRGVSVIRELEHFSGNLAERTICSDVIRSAHLTGAEPGPRILDGSDRAGFRALRGIFRGARNLARLRAFRRRAQPS